MEKKWVYNLGRILLFLGALLFIVSLISLFMRGFFDGNNVSIGTSEFGINYLDDGFMLLVIGILLVGFNKILMNINGKK